MKLYKIFTKTPFFLSVSNFISAKDNPIKGVDTRNAVIIPLLLLQFGSMRDKLKNFSILRKNFVSSIKNMRRSAKEIKLNPHSGKKTISNIELQELEDYIKSIGIAQLAYVQVNPKYIFNGFEILYDKAIMITMEMRRERMRHNPTIESSKEIWRTYAGLGEAVNQIAAWLRERGFNCQASPAVGGDVMTVPIAQDAGLGYVGKHGLLITPEFGPSQRLAPIFVDIDNLPLSKPEDNPHRWMRDFCETCNHCVEVCPGSAIFKETKVLSDGDPLFIDREKCAPIFSKNCAQCISSCPFFHGNYEKIKAAYEKHLADDKERNHLSQHNFELT